MVLHLEDLFLEGTDTDKLIDEDGPPLSLTVGTADGLFLNGMVPPRVKKNT